MSGKTREELIYLAKLAEQCERYDEMMNYVVHFCEATKDELTNDERTLVQDAFKNIVGKRRSSWRIINLIENKKRKNGEQLRSEHAKTYKHVIEGELTQKCELILNLLNSILLPKAKGSEYKIFLNKMRGDYYRYMAEYSEGQSKASAADLAGKAYDVTRELVFQDEKNGGLSATHPQRLGLALNYSVFYYEIKKDVAKASEIARDAFDEAIADLDNIDDDYYKDATLIMQLLRDNLTLWTEENEAE